MATKSKKKQTRTRPTQAHADAVRAAGEDWCAPADVSPIADYSFEIGATHQHHDGVYWEGVLYKGDRPILLVEDRGEGGALYFHPAGEAEYADKGEWRMLHDEFQRACDLAYGRGYENDGRAVSFLDAIANYADYKASF